MSFSSRRAPLSQSVSKGLAILYHQRVAGGGRGTTSAGWVRESAPSGASGLGTMTSTRLLGSDERYMCAERP